MEMKDKDILVALVDLHKQATTENSHYYTGGCVKRAIAEIVTLRQMLHEAASLLAQSEYVYHQHMARKIRNHLSGES